MAWLLAQRRRRVPSLQLGSRISNRGRTRAREGNGRVRHYPRRRRLAGDLYDRIGRAIAAQRPIARSLVQISAEAEIRRGIGVLFRARSRAG
jgi:hypothetical protein